MKKPFNVSTSTIVKFYVALAFLIELFFLNDFYRDTNTMRMKAKIKLTTLVTSSIALLLSYVTIRILQFFKKLPDSKFKISNAIAEFKSMPRFFMISFLSLAIIILFLFVADIGYAIMYVFYDEYLSNHLFLQLMVLIPGAIGLVMIPFLKPLFRSLAQREAKKFKPQSEDEKDSSIKKEG